MPKILNSPAAVFEGLRRDADEDNRSAGWLCYCGVPDRAYRSTGEFVPPWAGKVFLVFVNHDRVAYLWYWAKCDASDPKLPEGHETRFARRVL